MGSNHTIGITGGIGSGKSIVSRVLRCNGFKVYDCDFMAKALMNRNLIVKKALMKRFGDKVNKEDGSLDRAYLACIIFNDTESLKFTNQIVHKEVKEDIAREREKTKGLFFIESAILASSGIAEQCNMIWLVEAPLSVRIRRVEHRDNLSREDIAKRIESQNSEFSLIEKKKTEVIKNDDKNPILPFILAKIRKFNNFKTYIISC